MVGGGLHIGEFNSCLSWKEFSEIMSKSDKSRSSSISIFSRDMEINHQKKHKWTWVRVVPLERRTQYMEVCGRRLLF